MAALGFSPAVDKNRTLSDRNRIFSTLKPDSQSKKIGIIICGRYESCGGGKCLRSVRERVGGFARYPKEMPIDVVGFGQCGGCPGVNVEYVPAEMKKNGAEVIHLATGFVVGYPPCPSTLYFKDFIENYYDLPVVIGTHPVPLKYLNAHMKLPSMPELKKLAPYLLEEKREIMEAYN
ncbi:MAG: CGGC domain-containing protein [Candidatus Aminicenantes bacterium]|nr:CGGC domain-containing protein [Candidatus Aminicenantes bacterium]